MASDKEASKKATMTYLATLPTGFVADALGKMNLMHQGTIGIYPIRGFEDAHIAGPVVTIKFAPVRATGVRKPLSFFEVIKNFKPGTVICTQAGEYMTFTGDIQTYMAKQAGIVGMILDGSPRDLAGLRSVGLPIWSKRPATRLMSSLWELSGFNVPIELGGVQTHPGDFVVADEDGAVIVPQEVLEQTAELAHFVAEIEEELEKATKGGASLDEVAAIYARKGAKVPIKH